VIHGKVVGTCKRCGHQVRERYYSKETGLHTAISKVQATAEFSPDLEYCHGEVELIENPTQHQHQDWPQDPELEVEE
jgi:hypothetical protein